MIAVFINGKREEVEEGLNISKLLEFKKIRPEVVTVELNDMIIERVKFGQTQLKPDDKLEFVYYMGGGGSTHFVRSPFQVSRSTNY